jgi:anthranilate synthase component 1
MTAAVQPPLDEVLAHRGDHTHVAVSLELAADTETPISLYHKLSGDRPFAFLLESVEGGETLGRYSFIGFDVRRTLFFPPDSGAGDPLLGVEAALHEYRVVPRSDLPRFQGGAVGYLAFDAVRHFERVPLPARRGLGKPEALFLLTEELAIFDHLYGKLVLITHVPLRGDRERAYRAGCARLEALVERLSAPPPRPLRFQPAEPTEPGDLAHNQTSDAYRDSVARAKEAIAAGEVFQVVLSQRMTVPRSVSAFSLYRALRMVNPSPYMFYLRFDSWAVVGASPEVLVRLEGDEVLVRPIAGTRPRAKDRHRDAELEAELRADPKELAEHRMLLDLGRNDVGRIAELGTVEVERPLHVERYSHVMHLVSDVRAKLKNGATAFDVFRACFPAGTVSGAPKIRAMELIAELEPDRRGIYAGAVGYFDFSGNMDTCIAIRTMVVDPDAVHIQAGAGIVFDSDPEREDVECRNKARSALLAVQAALMEDP